jgi:DNA invertase Pin-like site-specific DNA recombinase
MTGTLPEKRLIGYARVSAYGQTFDSQLEQLRNAGCSSRNIYREKVTGATRPARAKPGARQAGSRRRGDGDTY